MKGQLDRKCLFVSSRRTLITNNHGMARDLLAASSSTSTARPSELVPQSSSSRGSLLGFSSVSGIWPEHPRNPRNPRTKIQVTHGYTEYIQIDPDFHSDFPTNAMQTGPFSLSTFQTFTKLHDRQWRMKHFCQETICFKSVRPISTSSRVPCQLSFAALIRTALLWPMAADSEFCRAVLSLKLNFATFCNHRLKRR